MNAKGCLLKMPYSRPAINRVPFTDIAEGGCTLRHVGMLRSVDSPLAANDILLVEGYKGAMQDLIRPLQISGFPAQRTSVVDGVEFLRLQLFSDADGVNSDVSFILFDLRDSTDDRMPARQILNTSANERICPAFLVTSIEALRKFESRSPNSCWHLKSDLAPAGLAESLKSYFKLHCSFLKSVPPETVGPYGRSLKRT
jgi:hypothetical protein